MNNRIPSLDGLRAISISMVVLAHATHTAPQWLQTNDPIWTLLSNGQLGVRMFFVISGFLITTLLKNEFEKNGQIKLGDFYMRRALRIFPAFYFYIFVIAGLSVFGLLKISISDLLLAGTFTWNYGHLALPTSQDAEGVMGCVWTLCLEEQFYLLWPITLILIGFRRGLVTALVLIVSMPMVRIATYFLWPEARNFMAMMLHTAADTLMIGSAIAILQGNPRFERWVPRLTSGWVTSVCVIFCLMISPWLKQKYRGGYDAPLGLTLEGLCLGIILLNVTRNAQTLSGKILNSKPFVTIGVLSYGIYLWNQLITADSNQTFTAIFPLNIVFTLLFATASYMLIEKPFLRIKDYIGTMKGDQRVNNNILDLQVRGL